MKRNNHPAGSLAFSGAIHWGMEIACFLIMALGLGIYTAVYLTSSVCGVPKIAQVEADFKSLDSSLMSCKLHSGSFPSTAQGLRALVEMPAGDPVPVRWSKIQSRVPLDPWGNPYSYQFPGSKDPEEFEIISRGPDGIAGSGDDLSCLDE